MTGRTRIPFGRKQPNAWGLYDMLGNVREWCQDGATSDLGEDSEGWGRRYGSDTVVDPFHAPLDRHSTRVVRGGSWGHDARHVRAAYRSAYHREARNGRSGFSSGPRSSVERRSRSQ